MKNYQKVEQILSDISALEGAIGVLQWDQEVIMPEGATPQRGKQMATLSALLHEKLTSFEMRDALMNASGEKLNETQVANLREAQRDFDRATKIPEQLVRDWSESTVRAHSVWIESRKEKNFQKFRPELEHLVQLAKKRAHSIDST